MTQTTITRIYKPLHELKYAYESHSKPTTAEVAVSTELPTIKRKSRSSDPLHETQNYKYSSTIKEILKMKLECGHIHDQISLIDLHMREEEAKHEEATAKHQSFVKAFKHFLSCQYQQVKIILAELAEHEQKSVQTETILKELERKKILRSLEIYDLERRWRQYKVSQNFLLHIAVQLKHRNSANEFRTFSVNPDCETPDLDDLVSNFEKHAISDRPFEEKLFKHVTAKNVSEYLRGLRKQNLRLLDLKLRYVHTKEDVQEERRRMEYEYEDREVQVRANIDETEKKIVTTELAQSNLQIATSEKKGVKSSKITELEDCVEKLYKSCFGVNEVKGSPFQMMRCVEEHCVMLLNKLGTFDSQTLKKVMR